jgi:hypothetical protein
VTKLTLKIDAEERARVMRKDTESLDAYDYVLRGWAYFLRYSRSANTKARQMFEKAIELDPHYATAYVGLGQTHSGSAATKLPFARPYAQCPLNCRIITDNALTLPSIGHRLK